MHKKENVEETNNGTHKGATILQSRRLKRKSEEGSVANSSISLTSPESESPTLRKYSRILQPNESENQIEDINGKKNALLFCESSGNTQEPSQLTYTTKNHNRGKDRKKPLVPQLHNLNEDEGSSTCAAGFILSPRAERPYKCNLCVKQFKYFSNLKSHVKIVHKKKIDSSPEDINHSTGVRGQVFQCEICFRNFKYFSNLRTHRLVHTSNDSHKT